VVCSSVVGRKRPLKAAKVWYYMRGNERIQLTLKEEKIDNDIIVLYGLSLSPMPHSFPE
jgi:hypothetical protein